MTASMNGHTHLFPGPILAELEDGSSLLTDTAGLARFIKDQGYLYMKGLLPVGGVLAARRDLLERCKRTGRLKPGTRLRDGIVNPEPTMEKRVPVKPRPWPRAVQKLFESATLLRLFDHLFSEPSLCLDLKIVRKYVRGSSTGIHYDIVYLGRGSRRVMTCWVPLGDIPVELGPLAVCAGSNSLHGFEKLRRTYGQLDVDQTLMRGAKGSFPGWFSLDLTEITKRFGGQWRTAHFTAGDVMVLTSTTLHCGLDNLTDHVRMSADLRFQPRSEPADPRWMGDCPPGNTEAHRLHRNELEADTTLEAARAVWGV